MSTITYLNLEIRTNGVTAMLLIILKWKDRPEKSAQNSRKDVQNFLVVSTEFLFFGTEI